MASEQSASAASTPSAQVVGNAFVHQYYHILHQSPELVYRFYQERSKLGRPESDGNMRSVTTMQTINEKILSMDYSNYRAEIKTVDAQESLNGGVLVLVTGYLTGKDNVRRNFTQSFFLATQDKGYYVLNDMFRYADEITDLQGGQGSGNDKGAVAATEQEVTPPQEQQATEQVVPPSEVEEAMNEEEVCNPSENGDGSDVEEIPVAEVINDVPSTSQAVLPKPSSTTIQEEAPKKSYASIVKVMKEIAAPQSVPTNAPATSTAVNPERQAVPGPAPAAAPAPEDPTTSSNSAEASTIQEAEADGHSIYIKNLPLNATPEQLEWEFKRFGPIKPGGIQVRSHKQQGFCFGFVEFEAASAVQSAIEASPIMICGRQAYVEEKRTGARVSTRGRFIPGRGGGFRYDGMRGRGSFGGGRAYGRGDYYSRVDFGNRGGGGGGSSNRGADSGYQRVNHTGGGRGNRPGLATNATLRNVTPRVPAPSEGGGR